RVPRRAQHEEPGGGGVEVATRGRRDSSRGALSTCVGERDYFVPLPVSLMAIDGCVASLLAIVSVSDNVPFAVGTNATVIEVCPPAPSDVPFADVPTIRKFVPVARLTVLMLSA